MAADSTKHILQELKDSSPTIRRMNDRRYKEAYSETVWALVDQVVQENERLSRQLDTIESMVKVLRNQSELTSHEFKEMRKAVESQNSKLKAITSSESFQSDTADDVNPKGE